MSLNITTKSETCNGANDGKISVSGKGGDGEYTFSFENSAYLAENSWESLAPGTYTVSVSDNTGCIATGILLCKLKKHLYIYFTYRFNHIEFSHQNGS